jgi:purine-binding chemotaxis protein CheW
MPDGAQYVTIGVAGELFAAPVEQVQEILEMRPIARMPNAPAAFLGMIDVRGTGVPVVDLRAKLGLPEAADTDHTRIIVLTLQGGAGAMTFGLRADRVFEVTALDGELEPSPQIGVQWSSESMVGLGRRNGAFVVVLNTPSLFASESAALRKTEAASFQAA